MRAVWRARIAAEYVGTAVLLAVVVGSGVMGTSLSHDTGVALLVNAVSTVAGLGVLIWLLGPVSGAHFNPAVSLWAWRRGTLTGREARDYAVAQIAGGVTGAVVANAMFGLPVVQVATHERATAATALGELIATAGLISVVALLGRGGRGAAAHLVVPAWIGSAYFFTSSTSFANPAVTIGRVFSDTFAGIAPSSVPVFVLAQLAGVAVGTWFVRALGE